MQDNNKLIELIELIEQAACSTNMLSPTDFSELDKLQHILDEIKENIADISEGPVQLLEQAKGSSCEASELLQKILQNEVEDTSKSIQLITQSVSALQGLIEQIEQASEETPEAADPEETETTADENTEAGSQQSSIPEEDVPLVLDFIAESGEHIESAEAGLLELETKPDDNEVLNQIFRAFHTIKGMAGFLNLTEIGSLAHSAENLLDLARKGELILAGENMDVVFESIDMLKKMIASLKESVEAGKAVLLQDNLPQLLAKLKSVAQGQSLADSLNTPQGQKNDKKLDEILESKEKKQAIKDESWAQNRRGETPRRSGSERRATADEKIKVSTSRLDTLINMTGELVIAQLMIAEEAKTNLASEHQLGRKVVHQSKIVRELQELSMSMRMVPIAGVFQKMARLVRDLSHKAGKDIIFSTQGEETELDRNIVDKIADPLVHMVRNSVDHGVESAEERVKAGKNPEGQIELRAFHQAGNIVIEIEDDGKGLDKERILQKAIENGIVDAGQELADDEIYKLIFHAGLSTAQKVTSVSGRGVGMDVVKKNIDSLRGKIDITSTKGKGTIFTIRMPLTLAIIDGQIVKIGDQRYVIPINSIIRTLKPEANQLSSVQNRGEIVTIRGQLLPLVRLYKLFNAIPTTEDPTRALLVIVEEDGKKCCLLVDELLGQQQVVIKSLGEGLGKAKGVSGGAIMGDGKVSLILDIPSLMELAQN